jgi:MFS family permease
MIAALVQSSTLIGLSVSIINLSRVLIAYPVGKLGDAHGRKASMYVGLSLALCGTLVVSLAMLERSFPVLVLGILLFGMGLGAAMQLRVAAADMYPPSRRGEGLGYVLTGSLAGILVAPVLVTLGQTLADATGLEPLALPWLFLPLVILLGLYCVWLIRPDPKEIATRLDEFFPGYRSEPVRPRSASGRVQVGELLRRYPFATAMAANFAAQGNMSIVMVITSVVLAHHGHGLPAISLSHAFHTAGMFAFSVPIGRLADRFGRRVVLLNSIVMSSIGALLVAGTTEYWSITLGAFLVGLGWSAANVASTAMLADTTAVWERGRAVGVNDTITAVGSTLIPLIVGPMAEAYGMPSTGVLAACLLIAPLFLLLALREPRPGMYAAVAGAAR